MFGLNTKGSFDDKICMFFNFQFLLRQQVVSLYRDFMKVTRHLPPGDREETRKWIKDDFKSNMHLTDEVILKVF